MRSWNRLQPRISAFTTWRWTYDTLYLAFAVAKGANAVVAADGPFLRSVRTHPDPSLSAMVISLDAWAKSRGGGTLLAE